MWNSIASLILASVSSSVRPVDTHPEHPGNMQKNRYQSSLQQSDIPSLYPRLSTNVAESTNSKLIA